MNLTTMDHGDTAVLRKAILLYERRSNVSGSRVMSYATLHPISYDDAGAATIAPGRLLRREALEAAMGDLAAGAGVKRYRFTDASVVASGPGMSAWFTPSQVRHMSFNSGKESRSGRASQPAMLWIATPKDLFVFALAGDARPSAQTPVYHAPHFNVWKGGRLCMGTARRPHDLDPQSWVTMFYESEFTHPNDGANWQTSHRGGVVALWTKLLGQQGKKPFDPSWLKPTGATLEQIVDAVMTTGSNAQ